MNAERRFETIVMDPLLDPIEEMSRTVDASVRRSAVVRVRWTAKTDDPLERWERVIRNLGAIASEGEDPAGHRVTSGGIWTDVRFDPQHRESFRFDNGAQPLHTDGAYCANGFPETAFFYCERQARAGGHSLFADVEVVADVLQSIDPELYRALRSTPVQFSKYDEPGRFEPILTRDERGARIHWNYYRIAPGQSAETVAMCERFRAFVERDVARAGAAIRFRLEPGDAVFFQDDRVLHGRESFEAGAAGDRLIWKCYVTLSSGSI